MTAFPIYTTATAPEQSQPALRQLQQTFGFVPNIAGVIAGSPTLLDAFAGLFQRVHSGTFSEAQIQTLLLTNAVTNACSWAVAFHTALALHEGLSPVDVEAIRSGRAPEDRLNGALSTLTKTAIEKRGRLDEHDVNSFIEVGFRRDQVLEALAVLAASTITNYAGNIAQPPLETQFDAHAWHA